MKRSLLSKIAACGILCAVAYVLTVFVRVPIFPAAPYLKLDFKDAIIVLGGFIYGPVAALLMSVVTSLVEMITVSESGVIGLIMNVAATCAFAFTASLIYKFMRNVKGVLVGLATGTVAMTVIMMLWNYILTPLYTPGLAREVVAGMLIPVFMPFNLIKALLNASAALIAYRPLIGALRRAKVLPPAEDNAKSNRTTAALVTVAVLTVVACVAAIVLNNIYRWIN